MILQALTGYYYRLVNEKGTSIAPEGFESKEIPFLIILDNAGKFVELRDTRNLVGRKLVPRKFTVPKEKSRSGSNAWQDANLLWDHYGYLLAHPKSESKKDMTLASKQHKAFILQVKTLLSQYPEDQEIKAVFQFLDAGNFKDLFNSSEWADCRRIAGCNLTFQIASVSELVCQNDNVQEYVNQKLNNGTVSEKSEKLPRLETICLVTGERTEIARLHPRTPIIGAKSNAKIVSFQRNMGFDSYGREQSYNAPVSNSAAFAYTTALNHLLSRESRQKIQVGEATTVFWAEKAHPFEGAFFELFRSDSSRGDEEQAYKSLIALFKSPEKGNKTELNPETKFYVLGLSPNAARIVIRFWYAGTVGSIARNIWQHFNDLEIVKGSKEWHSIGLHWLLRATVREASSFREWDKNIPPNLAGDSIKAILNGTPYPRTLLAATIRRCRAEHDVTYTRAALIKAILVRELRYYQQSHKEVSMSLDTTNQNSGYLTGRLFAALERTQEVANPGLNSTIRDRFYGAASATPATAFPQLMKLKNHHIAKMESKGQAVNLERLMGEIIDKIDATEGFPAHLNLHDQGRFAVGYYHQRQAFFTRKDHDSNSNFINEEKTND